MGVVPRHVEVTCFAGAVGEGPATEFKAFLDVYRDLPDPDNCIANPKTCTLPTKTNVKYALSAAIAIRCDAKNAANVFDLVKRFDAEFMILTLNLITNGPKSAEIVSTKAFTALATDERLRKLLV
jgi:hypothetical protein